MPEEPAVMLWTYGGAVNLETAGYVRVSEPDAEASDGDGLAT